MTRSASLNPRRETTGDLAAKPGLETLTLGLRPECHQVLLEQVVLCWGLLPPHHRPAGGDLHLHRGQLPHTDLC